MDTTESIRRQLIQEINGSPLERKEMEEKHEKVWNTTELQVDFEVVGFLAPFVCVRRKSDGVCGSMLFQHRPRFYYGFKEE